MHPAMAGAVCPVFGSNNCHGTMNKCISFRLPVPCPPVSPNVACWNFSYLYLYIYIYTYMYLLYCILLYCILLYCMYVCVCMCVYICVYIYTHVVHDSPFISLVSISFIISFIPFISPTVYHWHHSYQSYNLYHRCRWLGSNDLFFQQDVDQLDKLLVVTSNHQSRTFLQFCS
jgi:hypothetical protein